MTKLPTIKEPDLSWHLTMAVMEAVAKRQKTMNPNIAENVLETMRSMHAEIKLLRKAAA